MPTHPTWRDRGLTKDGAREADRAMPVMLEAARLSMTPDVAKQVFAEALFQVFELPTRSENFQEKHRWKAAR